MPNTNSKENIRIVNIYIVGPVRCDERADTIEDIIRRLIRKYEDNLDHLKILMNSEDKNTKKIVDKVMEDYKDIPVVTFATDFDKYGKQAYYKRHNRILCIATHVLVIANGELTRTQSSILNMVESMPKSLLYLNMNIGEQNGKEQEEVCRNHQEDVE